MSSSHGSKHVELTIVFRKYEYTISCYHFLSGRREVFGTIKILMLISSLEVPRLTLETRLSKGHSALSTR